MSIINNVLAIITARGGSKGLPGKNILEVDGRPLIDWTIKAAKDAKSIDKVILSSDDQEIIRVAKSLGCEVPFTRPSDLATDTATSIDVVLHAISELPGFDYVVLLQPTSPLRTAADIDSAFSLMNSKRAPGCVSVCESDQSPYWMFEIIGDSKLCSVLPLPPGITRRQDLPVSYVLNGAIYIANIQWLRETRSFSADGSVAYVMSKDRSLDIDTLEDFKKFRAAVLKNRYAVEVGY